jgi:glycosyltransferase involved in cell wall biosynthesis
VHVAVVIHSRIPVSKYGGVQRMVIWNIKGLSELGHRVTLVAPKGSRSPYAAVAELPRDGDLRGKLPASVDLVHDYSFCVRRSDVPVLCTSSFRHPSTHRFPPNTIFLSRSHAELHGHSEFVHNGLDPSEYRYAEEKGGYFLFLSKVSRSSKGVDTAVRLARDMGFRLVIAGGYRWTWSRKIRSVGEVGGRKKAELLAGARALLFPIRWQEPFGIVTIEAMVSGTPVITTPFGAMEEIVTPDVGFVCPEYADLKTAVERIGSISPAACRRRVLEHFTDVVMARHYEVYYRRLLETGSIHAG